MHTRAHIRPYAHASMHTHTHSCVHTSSASMDPEPSESSSMNMLRACLSSGVFSWRGGDHFCATAQPASVWSCALSILDILLFIRTSDDAGSADLMLPAFPPRRARGGGGGCEDEAFVVTPISVLLALFCLRPSVDISPPPWGACTPTGADRDTSYAQTCGNLIRPAAVPPPQARRVQYISAKSRRML